MLVHLVGYPMSGISLLAAMLQSHTDLAVTPDHYILHAIADRASTMTPASLRTAILSDVAIADTGLTAAKINAVTAAIIPWSTAAATSAIYGSLAATARRPHCIARSSTHIRCLLKVAALLPATPTIHLVRDGRDVAASNHQLVQADPANWTDLKPWTRPDYLADWAAETAHVSRFGPTHLAPHYIEVRYEDLVANPAAQLQRICAHLVIAYQPAMLSFAAAAQAQLNTLGPIAVGPTIYATAVQRRAYSPLLTAALTTSRVGRWKAEWTSGEVSAITTEARDALARFGYDVSSIQPMPGPAFNEAAIEAARATPANQPCCNPPPPPDGPTS